MTLRSWKGKDQSTVKGGVAMTGVQKLFSENRAFCEIMWKLVVQPDRTQMKIWCTRIAWWVNKATHTHTHTPTHTYTHTHTHTQTHIKYVILIGFHCKNGYMNAPQFCVIRTLPILFILTIRQRNNFVLRKYFCLEFHIFFIILISKIFLILL
jgi:hypothetical protein